MALAISLIGTFLPVNGGSSTSYQKVYGHIKYSIRNELLNERIQNYLFIDPKEEFVSEKNESLPQSGIHIGTSYLSVPDIEDAYLLGIVRALVDTKQQIKKTEEAKSHASETRYNHFI